MMQDKVFQRFSVGTIWLWLAIFALIPSFLLFMTSILVQGDSELVRLQITVDNYLRLFKTPRPVLTNCRSPEGTVNFCTNFWR